MKRVLAVAGRDIKRAAKAPVGILLQLLIPLILTAIIGLAFGGSSGDEKMPPMKLLVWDRDEGFVGHFLSGMLGQREVSERLDVTVVNEEGLALMSQGKASAMLIIPPDFSESIFAGRTATLNVVKNPAERFMPVVAECGTRLMGTVLGGIIRIMGTDIPELDSAFDEIGTGQGGQRVSSALANIGSRFGSVAEKLSPWPVSVEFESPDSGERTFNLFAYILPGITVMMLLLIAQKLLREIHEEIDTGTLSAILATPINAREYMIGKLAGLLFIILLGFLLLIVLGFLLFSISWGNPFSVFIIAGAFAVAASGLMMLLSGLVKSSRQAEALGITVVLVLSLVGGSMIPFRPTQGIFALLSRLTPNRWAIDGFLASIEGARPYQVFDEAGVLLGAGVIMLLLGGTLLSRKLTR